MRHSEYTMCCKDVTALDTGGSPAPPAEDGTVLGECASESAPHDLAALGQGKLSPEGLERLAGHIAECRPCLVILSSLVQEAEALAALRERPPELRIVRDPGGG